MFSMGNFITQCGCSGRNGCRNEIFGLNVGVRRKLDSLISWNDEPDGGPAGGSSNCQTLMHNSDLMILRGNWVSRAICPIHIS